jgi:hypothetical protein
VSIRTGKQPCSSAHVSILTCHQSWVLAADSTIEHLASHPSSRPDLTYLASFNHTALKFQSGHLACFDGGNFILGGLVLEEQKYIDFGLQLVASCENTYNQTLTGIGPEGFGWDESKVPANQTEFYERAGFYITSSDYVLRPEVLESFYYAYRATGDRKYRDVCRSSPPMRSASHWSEQNTNVRPSGPSPASKPSSKPPVSAAATAPSPMSTLPTVATSLTSRNHSSSPKCSSTRT